MGRFRVEDFYQLWLPVARDTTNACDGAVRIGALALLLVISSASPFFSGGELWARLYGEKRLRVGIEVDLTLGRDEHG